MLAPLAFIFFFSFRINQMAASTARTMFFAFSAVMGLSLSSILLFYTKQSVSLAFFETSAAFGALSLYGYTTKRSLSAMGSFLIMGLFGIVIASVVNIFVAEFGLPVRHLVPGDPDLRRPDRLGHAASIKQMYDPRDGADVATKKSVNGALMLYLDFINIFQNLLYLMGNRNN